MAERMISDIGGLDSGGVPRDEVPPLFWEKQMVAMFNVLWGKGITNLDEMRCAVESMTPDVYKKSSFYGRRIEVMSDLLATQGFVDREELERRAQEILRGGTRDLTP